MILALLFMSVVLYVLVRRSVERRQAKRLAFQGIEGKDTPGSRSSVAASDTPEVPPNPAPVPLMLRRVAFACRADFVGGVGQDGAVVLGSRDEAEAGFEGGKYVMYKLHDFAFWKFGSRFVYDIRLWLLFALVMELIYQYPTHEMEISIIKQKNSESLLRFC